MKRALFIVLAAVLVTGAGCESKRGAAKGADIGRALTGRPATHEDIGATSPASTGVAEAAPEEPVEKEPEKKEEPSFWARLFGGGNGSDNNDQETDAIQRTEERNAEALDVGEDFVRAQEGDPVPDEEEDGFWDVFFPEPKALTIHPDTIEQAREKERKRRARKKKMTILGRIFGKKSKYPGDTPTDAQESTQGDSAAAGDTSCRAVELRLVLAEKASGGLALPVPLTCPGQRVSDLRIETSGTPVARFSAKADTFVIDVTPTGDDNDVSAELTCRVRRDQSASTTPARAARAAEALYSASGRPAAELADKTREIAGTGDRTERARSVFRFICESVALSEEGGGGPNDPAETLSRGSGKVSDLAALFVALCRAADVPAREIRGVKLPAKRLADFHEVRRLYSWAEFLNDREEWVSVDLGAAKRRTTDPDDTFGRLAGDVLALAVCAAAEATLPPLIAAGGDDRGATLQVLVRDAH